MTDIVYRYILSANPFSDNLTYDVGFHNPGALDTSFSLYDDVNMLYL